MRDCYFVAQQGLAQRRRCALIKKHFHSCHFKSAFCSVLKHRARLLCQDAGEPSHEVMQRGAVLKVFKQRRNRNPSVTKHPCTADAAGVSFNSDA